jgi:Domain of unknown function (DUF4124)
MHPWRPWIVLATLAAFASQAAVIYKWTDSNGVVHYSDQPVPGAEKIVTSSSPSSGATSSANASGNGTAPGAAPKKNAPPGLNYTQFAITSPLPNQTFFGEDVVSVHLALEPALKPNQTITWHLNGKQLEDQGSDTVQFTIGNLNRGTYALAATITDQQTGESQSTDSVSFFVRQPSELAPLHQRP